VEERRSHHLCSYTHATTSYIKENESKDMSLLILSQRGSKLTRGGTYGSGKHGSSGTIRANYNVRSILTENSKWFNL
jgi:hypothetical protein